MRATNSEILLRYLNNFLSVEEFHNRDPNSERVRLAFWKGVSAHKKLLMSKAKSERRKAKENK